MKNKGIVFVACCVLLNTTIFAKGTVDIGSDSIEIMYDAYPVKNTTDYSISFNTIWSTNGNLISKSSNSSLSLNQISKLSNASENTIKYYSDYSKLEFLNVNPEKSRKLKYIAPQVATKSKASKSEKTTISKTAKKPVMDIIVNGKITAWGRDDKGKQLKCTVTVKQSILGYISIKSTFESFGPGKLLVIFVNDNGQCAGAEMS